MKMGEYFADYCPGHPRSTPQGVVYRHVLVAEEILGRFLKPCEVVHHIDQDKLNNQPSNLIVFATNAEHVRFHNYGCDSETLVITEDCSYLCCPKRSTTEKTTCSICGKLKDRKAKICMGCRNVIRAASIPNYDELKRVLVELNWNFSAAGRRYSVTDNAVRKWCKKYGIMPMSSRGRTSDSYSLNCGSNPHIGSKQI